MSEKVKYGPRAVPGLFWVVVVIFLAVTAYGVSLVAPTIAAFATPGTKGQPAAGADQPSLRVTVGDLRAERTQLSAAKEGKPAASSDTYTAKYGALTDGALGIIREGAHLTWRGEADCASGDKPIYQLTVRHSAISKADSDVERSYTTTTTSRYLPGILNGLKYDFTVAGRCPTVQAYGDAAATTFTQTLPTPRGVIVKKQRAGSAYTLMYGRVSSSPAVDYTIEYRRGGDWALFKTVDTGELYTAGPAGFYSGYGIEFRIRAYTVDDTQQSDWSGVSTLRYESGVSGGYNSYGSYSNY